MSVGMSVVKLLSGRIMAQLLGFLIVPFLTRLFWPEHFGLLQLFTSLALIVIPVAALKYELSIPLARTTSEARICLFLSGAVTVSMSVLVFGVIAVGQAWIAARFHAPQLRPFLWFLPLAVLAGGIGNALKAWAARTGEFGVIAWADLGTTTVDKLLPLLWGVIIGVSARGLFLGRISSLLVNIGILLILLTRHARTQHDALSLNLPILWETAKRYKKFPLFSSWGVFLNAISMQIPSLMLGAFFPATVIGYYTLSYNVISFPMNLLSDSVAQVFFPAAAKEYQHCGSLAGVVQLFFVRLVQLGTFPMAALAWFGPLLFRLAFGSQWLEAGVYSQMLSIWWFIAFVNLPLRIFELLDRQEAGLSMNIILVIGRIVGFWLGAATGSPRLTLGIFVAISVGCLLGSTIWKLRVAGVSLGWAGVTMLQYWAIACGLLFLVKMVAWLNSDVRVVMASLSLAAVIYLGALMMLDRSCRAFACTLVRKLTNPGQPNRG